MQQVRVIVQRRYYRKAKDYLDSYQVRDYQVENLEDETVRLTLGRHHAANLIAKLPSGSVRVQR